MKYKINNNDGIAFVMVILLLALVGSLATAMLIMNSSNIDLASDATARSKAFYAAEGGVNYLDLKLDKFYKDNIVGEGIFSAEKIEDKLKEMQVEIKKDNLKIDNFDIIIDFNTGVDKDDSIYVYEIIADNGSESETIKVQYRIEHLIDYFKYSRFANKINISGNSSFENVDDNSFGTYETAYSKWSSSSSYFNGELIVHNNKVYVSKDDYSKGEAVEPGEDNWNNYWQIDNSFKEWVEGDSYKSRAKVIYNNEIYTSKTKENKSKPGTNGGWELNNPDLAKEELSLAKDKVDYNQSALPDPEDENNQEYMDKIIEEFKGKLEDESGYTYEDDQGGYPEWSRKSYSPSTKDKIIYDGKVYKVTKQDSDWVWRNNGWFGGYWEKITLPQPKPQPDIEPDSEDYNGWRDYWVEMNAGQSFIDNYSSYDHNNSGKGNYVYIDGDLTPNESESIQFSKPDEVLHILVDGKISPYARLELKGDANIIFYTTADQVSFKNGEIMWYSNQEINLGYFAPFAKYEKYGKENKYDSNYASSMIFNEITLRNENVRKVNTFNKDSLLREGIDPTIAQLTRSFGDPDYDIENAGSGPTRVNWSVE